MTSNNLKLLITGSSGFIGKSLVNSLLVKNYELTVTVRKLCDALPSRIKQIKIVDLFSTSSPLQIALSNIDTVIHLAGRAHILHESCDDPLKEFRQINTDGTLKIAQQAAESGVRRLIFISSIGVNGNSTTTKPFAFDDAPNPTALYAISKNEAEIGLRRISEETGMEIVIIRPPLVYGADAPGNFGRLIQTVARGIPLPLASINNKRSLVALDNLIDFITLCIDHPQAANETFLVSDDEDLSTTDLLRRMANALGKPSRLLPVPPSLLTIGATLLGKKEVAQRLCGSLQVDIEYTKKTLAWKPLVSVDEALQKTANEFLEGK